MSSPLTLLIKGGPMMWPLLVSAVLSLAVIFERTIYLTKANPNNDGLMARIKNKIHNEQLDEAAAECDAAPGPVARLLAGGLREHHQGPAAVERTMEELALRETPQLYKRLNWLDTIITVAPLLGLLGTVTGMIKSFHVVASSAGLSQPLQITGGVAEALIATATGLAIAIVTLVAYNLLTEKVKDVISEMEIRATQLSNMLPRGA